MAVQEGVPLEENLHLSRIFGPEVLGKLPSVGAERVRRTAIVLIGEYSEYMFVSNMFAYTPSGTYATWFTTQYTPPPGTSSVPSLLMNAISYVVAALSEPALCLPAANSLRDLCDANRTALAPHISAFGELHANLVDIPVWECPLNHIFVLTKSAGCREE